LTFWVAYIDIAILVHGQTINLPEQHGSFLLSPDDLQQLPFGGEFADAMAFILSGVNQTSGIRGYADQIRELSWSETRCPPL